MCTTHPHTQHTHPTHPTHPTHTHTHTHPTHTHTHARGTVMPAAQAAQVMGSDGFQEFFDRATRVVERALCEKYDVTVDYSGNDDEEGYAICVCV